MEEALQLTAKKVKNAIGLKKNLKNISIKKYLCVFQVKEVVLRRSHFVHIPLPGLVLQQTDRQQIHFTHKFPLHLRHFHKQFGIVVVFSSLVEFGDSFIK